MAKHYSLYGGREIDRRGGGDDHGDMEGRVAKLESDVGHIQTGIADLRNDVRSVREKLDKQLIFILTAFGGGFGFLILAILGLYAK